MLAYLARSPFAHRQGTTGRRRCQSGQGGAIRPAFAVIVLFLAACMLGAIAAASASAAKLVDRIVAYVNDEVITLSELEEKVQALVKARQENPFLRQEEEPLDLLRQRVLDNLINELLADQEIARLQISVSSAEIEEVITKIKDENNLSQEALEAQLRKQGMTLEDFRQQIRQQLERTRLIDREVRKKTVITDEQIEKYYQEHLEEFESTKRVRLRDIFLPLGPEASESELAAAMALAAEIRRKVLTGADFAAMARRYSRGPGAEEGGDLGYFAKGELEPSLEKALEGLQPGEITAPVPTPRGIHLLQVVEKETTPPKSLPQVREIIRRRLYQEEINRKYHQWLEQLRQRSYVKVVY